MGAPSKKPTVFISYSHADSRFVDELADKLKASGVDVWIDKWKFKVGDSITHKINEGIGASDFLIIVLSCASVKSKWVREELNAALIKNVEEEKHAFILPVLIEEWKIPPLLQHRKYANFKDDPEQAFQKLLEVIRPEVTLAPARLPFEPEMILIPACQFLMGGNPRKDKGAYPEEKRQHRLYLPDYYLAKTPVTNSQYVVFIQAISHDPPEHWQGMLPPPGKEEHPVVNVSWYDALAYSRWLAQVTCKSYGLPSEAEWEKGARGTDGRIYPWGNQWDPKRCNSYESGKDDTSPVGACPAGASPYGLLDMAGNVWEWTRSLWGKQRDKPYFRYPYDSEDGRENLEESPDVFRVLRGGAFINYQWLVRCAYRYRLHPGDRHRGIGFRVVVSP
jgi:formylglycine-generating enzyme required for sulfatase activity